MEWKSSGVYPELDKYDDYTPEYAAKRHIHMTPADAEEFGLQDKDIVSVQIDNNGRGIIFGEVVVRVSPSYALAMHIDTDESNAAGMAPGTMGEVIK